MYSALQTLGISLQWDKALRQMEVDGCCGRWPSRTADLNVANSGTTMRFLTGALSTGAGQYRLDGVPHMRERPIGDLLRAVQQLGATVVSEYDNDCPPVIVRDAGWAGGTATVRGDISSQFLSGLLLAAPCAQAGDDSRGRNAGIATLCPYDLADHGRIWSLRSGIVFGTV